MLSTAQHSAAQHSTACNPEADGCDAAGLAVPFRTYILEAGPKASVAYLQQPEKLHLALSSLMRLTQWAEDEVQEVGKLKQITH